MKIKTENLEGAALDWAVATAQGWYVQVGMKAGDVPEWNPANCTKPMIPVSEYKPSTWWSQGGPLIEKNRISIEFYGSQWGSELKDSNGHVVGHPDPAMHMEMASRFCPAMGSGPSPLIAAMRALVESKLGSEVDVPDELVNL